MFVALSHMPRYATSCSPVALVPVLSPTLDPPPPPPPVSSSELKNMLARSFQLNAHTHSQHGIRHRVPREAIMTPVPRITCEILPHPRIKLRARIAHGGGRRPGNEAIMTPHLFRKLACFLVFLCSKDFVYKESQLLQVSRLTCYRNHAVVKK